MSNADRKKLYQKILLCVVGSILAATVASVVFGYLIGTNTDHHKHDDRGDGGNITESKWSMSITEWTPSQSKIKLGGGTH